MNQRLVWNFEFSPKNTLNLSSTVNESDNLKWEIRFFWPGDQIITLHPIDDKLLDISNYQQKHKEDYYYLLPDSHYNIKRRRDELLYKPILKQSDNAVGFGSKINLEELSSISYLKPEELINLQKIRQQTQEKGKEIAVRKDAFIFKFQTTPGIKLELARLEVNNKVYFSVCIEGKSLNLVETISEHLLDKYVSCDYVTFLKSIIKS